MAVQHRTDQRWRPGEGLSQKSANLLVRVWRAPELSFLVFGMAFNFMWEVMQKPFFVVPTTMTHAQSALQCLNYSFRDALLLVGLFWAVSLFESSRNWIAKPTVSQVMVFVGVGLIWTAVLETFHIQRQDWTYTRQMPRLPVIGIGLVPLLQWLLLPPFVLFVVRTQILGISSLFHSKPKENSHE